MKTLVLNQTNIVSDGKNSTLVYKFPNSVTFTNHHIAVNSIAMFYSWDNISRELANHYLTFNWISANNTNTYQTYTVYIPNGVYNIQDLNSYLQFVMINAPNLSTDFISPTPNSPMYLVDNAGNYVFYFEIFVNPTAYAVQLNTYNVPTSLPTGYTNPAGTFLPAQTFNPVVTFPSRFNLIVGYASNFASDQNQNNAGTNLGLTTAYKIGSTFSYLSTVAPQVQPNSNVLVSMSGVDNKYANKTSVIYSFAPDVSVGEQIKERPAQFAFNKLINGTYNELRLQLLGTDFNPLTVRDPNMAILLVIKEPDEI